MRQENDLRWSVDEAIRLLSATEDDEEVTNERGERLAKKLKTLQGASSAQQAAALDSRAELLLQRSVGSNTKTTYISALKGYQKYCQTRGAREFPVKFVEIRRWISLANTAETATLWLSAIKKACVLVHAPFEFSNFQELEIKTMIGGIKRGQPTRRVDGDIISRECFCNGIDAFAAVCPVHVIGKDARRSEEIALTHTFLPDARVDSDEEDEAEEEDGAEPLELAAPA
eukprot:g19653.t1